MSAFQLTAQGPNIHETFLRIKLLLTAIFFLFPNLRIQLRILCISKTLKNVLFLRLFNIQYWRTIQIPEKFINIIVNSPLKLTFYIFTAYEEDFHESSHRCVAATSSYTENKYKNYGVLIQLSDFEASNCCGRRRLTQLATFPDAVSHYFLFISQLLLKKNVRHIIKEKINRAQWNF